MHNKIAQWWGGGKERLGNQVEIKRKQKRQGTEMEDKLALLD